MYYKEHIQFVCIIYLQRNLDNDLCTKTRSHINFHLYTAYTHLNKHFMRYQNRAQIQYSLYHFSFIS